MSNRVLPCQKHRPTKRAADGWILTAKMAFLWLWVLSGSGRASSRQPPETQTVRWLLGRSRGLLKNFELQV